MRRRGWQRSMNERALAAQAGAAGRPLRNVRNALAAATRRLESGSATPRLDAELLMAHALGLEREALLLSTQDVDAPPAFDDLAERRARGEPVAYLIGRRAFWTIEIEVGPGALVPRPDSETLIEAAAEHFGKTGPSSILDLGTGPGTLLLAGLDQWPAAHGVGIDSSAKALGYARSNAERLGMADRSDFRLGDWGEGVEQVFDLVLCNPPYVEAGAALPRDVSDWEPPEALFAGADGLEAYRRLTPMLGRLIAPRGIACVEIGAAQQAATVSLFRSHGLDVSVREDLAGRPRCLVLAA